MKRWQNFPSVVCYLCRGYFPLHERERAGTREQESARYLWRLIVRRRNADVIICGANTACGVCHVFRSFAFNITLRRIHLNSCLCFGEQILHIFFILKYEIMKGCLAFCLYLCYTVYSKGMHANTSQILYSKFQSKVQARLRWK